MTWIETPLLKFGSKCIMSEHDFCADSLCECLCHRSVNLSLENPKTTKIITHNKPWLNSKRKFE